MSYRSIFRAALVAALAAIAAIAAANAQPSPLNRLPLDRLDARIGRQRAAHGFAGARQQLNDIARYAGLLQDADSLRSDQ